MLFNGLLEVPIEFVIDKLLAEEKLILPNGVAVVITLRVLLESMINEPPPVKFTVSLSPIEEAKIFDESIMAVADRAGCE
jgi:hypothetical protein